ncbi:hypothetical protein NP233_g760 [Leucocoprinus birnbaumii]|uniref:Uncharacterized protein n=1 Tax=Leucocoprinus birnbaumii TaxID=56174 RepID=A0AAD5Z037_9AGAR|nr:hypothetical protein NP233_g760 [Leucocoprinus birnbaumii]
MKTTVFYPIQTISSAHDGAINYLKLNATGDRLASGGDDCKIASMGPCAAVFGSHSVEMHLASWYLAALMAPFTSIGKRAVEDLAFDSNRGHLVSVGDSRLLLWSFGPQGALTQINGTQPRESLARSVCFLDFGASVLVAFLQSHEVIVYDVDSWTMKGYYKLTTRIGHATLGCSQRTLLVSNLSTGVDVYDLPPSKPIRMLRHVVRKNVPLLVASALGDSIAFAGSDDGIVRVFDQRTGSLIATLHHGSIGTLVQVVHAVSLDESNCVVASATSDEKEFNFEIKIWSTKDPAHSKMAPALDHSFHQFKQSWKSIMFISSILLVFQYIYL